MIVWATTEHQNFTGFYETKSEATRECEVDGEIEKIEVKNKSDLIAALKDAGGRTVAL